MCESFSEKIIIVTGGTSGIGKAVCNILSKRGASVVVNYRTSKNAAEQLVGRLQERQDALAVQGDVSHLPDVEKIVRSAIETYGRIDGLVNNASFSAPELWKASPEQISLEDWKRALDVDLTGAYLMTNAVVPHMKKVGAGKIVNLSSGSAMRGDPNTFAYNSAKAGVNGLTISFAKLLAPDIQVNAIAPGAIDTGWAERWQLSGKQVGQLDSVRIPSRRFGKPEEVADLASFLLSGRADFITGQIIGIDGGANI